MESILKMSTGPLRTSLAPPPGLTAPVPSFLGPSQGPEPPIKIPFRSPTPTPSLEMASPKSYTPPHPTPSPPPAIVAKLESSVAETINSHHHEPSAFQSTASMILSSGFVPIPTPSDFSRVRLHSDKENEGPELVSAAKRVFEAMEYRKKYTSRSLDCPAPDVKYVQLSDVTGFVVEDGVYILVDKSNKKLTWVPSVIDFFNDYQTICDLCDDGPVKSFTYYQLKKLDTKWKLHQSLNEELEIKATRLDPKDFSNVVKVDTHIHLAAGMTKAQLMGFIKDKAKNFADDVIGDGPNGKILLKDVFSKLNIEIEQFTIDMLDVHADNTFQRFDKFNSKYNPFGKSELRDIFLKTSNHMNGRYFAELTKQLFATNAEAKYIKTECRLSIYGRANNEWASLAKWANSFDVYSPSNQWMIQIPRIYHVFKSSKSIKNFQEYLDNIFEPMYRATLDPTYDPDISKFLQSVSGFDSVDDESRPDFKMTNKTVVLPINWDSEDNPPYGYYLYFVWANLAALNQLRALKGLNTFDLRPHCGESGDVNHLAAAFLVVKHINHGINLERSTSLQYLYYLAQIGLAVCPLSNDSLFLDLKRNPFPTFFKRGLNVSLSTDDPLQFHLTESPLIEEYSVASQRWHMSGIDISEIARNSVLQSGFTPAIKRQWLGENYRINDVRHTNVPDIRVTYRNETLNDEFKFLERLRAKTVVNRPIIMNSFAKVKLEHPPDVCEYDADIIVVCALLDKALKIREKYKFATTEPKQNEFYYEMISGVYHLFDKRDPLCANDEQEYAAVYCYECQKKYCIECDRVLHKAPHMRKHNRTLPDKVRPVFSPNSYEEFLSDYIDMIEFISEGRAIAFCDQRLGLLDAMFDYYKLMNDRTERKIPTNTDWEHTVKVDTHVHASAGMKDVKLLQFIKDKIKYYSNDVVMVVNNKPKTLGDVYEEIGIPLESFTLDSLDMKAEKTFKRFDCFKSHYNPFGHNELRSIFLKSDNYQRGKYFAELMTATLKEHEKNEFLKYEYRLSICGKYHEEWDNLAFWALNFSVHSDCNRWVIQVPRIYHIVKDNVTGHFNFEQFLKNVFKPLFEVTEDPSKHPELSKFLENVSGFDSVDDESLSERKIEYGNSPPPNEWESEENPPYAYYTYYFWANLQSLNYFRQLKGLNTFSLRPHCGQSGDVSHLIAGFFFAESVAHGIHLHKSPVLQYLFYMAQIGIAVSPLGENTMFTTYERNPFPQFFKRGLNCSLSTDNPLMLHISDEALLEEYSIAAKVWKLSIVDLSEIARNSVLQSGFLSERKKEWIGDNYSACGVSGNDMRKTNIPNIRLMYRQEAYEGEKKFINDILQKYSQQSGLSLLK